MPLTAAPSADCPRRCSADGRLWQSWLDVEAALARAQARLGMIPGWAAEGIAAAADLDILGAEAVEADSAPNAGADPVADAGAGARRRPGRRLCALGRDHPERDADRPHPVDAAGRRGDPRRAGAGAGPHGGRWPRDHADTLMAGRTNRRHALPITFGFKVAGWIEEMDRAADRLADGRRPHVRAALWRRGRRDACLWRTGARAVPGAGRRSRAARAAGAQPHRQRPVRRLRAATLAAGDEHRTGRGRDLPADGGRDRRGRRAAGRRHGRILDHAAEGQSEIRGPGAGRGGRTAQHGRVGAGNRAVASTRATRRRTSCCRRCSTGRCRWPGGWPTGWPRRWNGPSRCRRRWPRTWR